MHDECITGGSHHGLLYSILHDHPLGRDEESALFGEKPVQRALTQTQRALTVSSDVTLEVAYRMRVENQAAAQAAVSQITNAENAFKSNLKAGMEQAIAANPVLGGDAFVIKSVESSESFEIQTSPLSDFQQTGPTGAGTSGVPDGLLSGDGPDGEEEAGAAAAASNMGMFITIGVAALLVSILLVAGTRYIAHLKESLKAAKTAPEGPEEGDEDSARVAVAVLQPESPDLEEEKPV